MHAMYYRVRPRGKLRQPPIVRCDLCGRSLLCAERYHVKLVLKRGPLRGTVFKTLHVCRDCLARIRADREIAKKFKVKYYRMKTLCLRGFA